MAAKPPFHKHGDTIVYLDYRYSEQGRPVYRCPSCGGWWKGR